MGYCDFQSLKKGGAILWEDLKLKYEQKRTKKYKNNNKKYKNFVMRENCRGVGIYML